MSLFVSSSNSIQIVRRHCCLNLDTDLPPTDQWKFYDGDVWAVDDHSLSLEHAFLPLACDLVRVEGEGEVVEKQGKSLGDYRSCY